MTMNFMDRALINLSMDSWFYDGVTAKLVNKGTLGGTVQLGNGTTTSTFPTQVFPHGMSFDGGDYLLRAEATNELTFTDPAPFSVEGLIRRGAVALGTRSTFICKNGGGVANSASYLLYLYNNAGTMRVAWGGFSSGGSLRGINEVVLGSYWPENVVTHVCGVYTGTTWILYINSVAAFTSVAAGCYAPDAPGGPLLIGAWKPGAGVIAAFLNGALFNTAVYPFALQPGEIAQLYRKRLGLLNRGA